MRSLIASLKLFSVFSLGIAGIWAVDISVLYDFRSLRALENDFCCSGKLELLWKEIIVSGISLASL